VAAASAGPNCVQRCHMLEELASTASRLLTIPRFASHDVLNEHHSMNLQPLVRVRSFRHDFNMAEYRTVAMAAELATLRSTAHP
jgi:hypothetical protein